MQSRSGAAICTSPPSVRASLSQAIALSVPTLKKCLKIASYISVSRSLTSKLIELISTRSYTVLEASRVKNRLYSGFSR